MTSMNFDETTSEGAKNVTLKILVDLGYLAWADDEHTLLRVPDSSPWRRLYLFGDQLTVDRVASMIPNMMELLGDLKTVEGAKEVLKALSSVFLMMGDLHVNMHFLDAMFRLCYGAFLQVFQTVLGWKRLRKEVIDSYLSGNQMK